MRQAISDPCVSAATASVQPESSPSDERYTRQLMLKLTEADYDLIVRLSAHHGVSVEQALRDAIHTHAYTMQGVLP